VPVSLSRTDSVCVALGALSSHSRLSSSCNDSRSVGRRARTETVACALDPCDLCDPDRSRGTPDAAFVTEQLVHPGLLALVRVRLEPLVRGL
jgi:hypothetical protein